jgi:hypothetical protein
VPPGKRIRAPRHPGRRWKPCAKCCCPFPRDQWRFSHRG